MSLDRKFSDIDKKIDGILGNTERQIGRQYAKLNREIRHLLSDYFAEYETEGSLKYETMAKYNRMENFEKKIRDKIRKEGTTPIAREIRKGLRSSVSTAFDETKSGVEEAAGRKIQGTLKRDTINEIIQTPDSGLKLNDRLQRRRADVIDRVRETLTQGMTRGETYKQMTDRLKEELERDTEKAYRIVRTEGHRVQESGKHKCLEHAKNQGVKMKKWWDDAGDERVRDKHAHMGEKYSKDNAIPFEENFVNDVSGGEGPHPGRMGTAVDDIHCRCQMRIIIEDVE